MHLEATQEQASKNNVVVNAALQQRGKLPRPESREEPRAQDRSHWPEDLNCHV